jgi:hypothetical protein
VRELLGNVALLRPEWFAEGSDLVTRLADGDHDRVSGQATSSVTNVAALILTAERG